MTEQPLLGSIETGGTKIICAVGYFDGTVVEKHRFRTSDPESSMEEIVAFFDGKGISSLGVASFGPLDLKEGEGYGSILDSPKEGWSGLPLAARLSDGIGVPVKVDTDVNAACLAESVFGAGKGCSVVAYITAGTGIGAGIVIDGKPLHGAMHPEGGHTSVTRHPDDCIDSVCPFHPDCAEGFASGPAFNIRCDAMGEKRAMELESFYLAQLVRNCMMFVSPEKVILGGGVMERGTLYRMVAEKTSDLTNGFLRGDVQNRIVAPMLGGDQGIIGGLILARQCLEG